MLIINMGGGRGKEGRGGGFYKPSSKGILMSLGCAIRNQFERFKNKGCSLRAGGSRSAVPL